MGMRRREIPANIQPAIAWVSGPDHMSQMLASSLAFATTTSGIMAAGVHTSGTDRGFAGVNGHGVNRWAGRTDPQQGFTGAAAPNGSAEARRLGFGAGPSGSPGLPNTGGNSALGWLGYVPGGRPGIGG